MSKDEILTAAEETETLLQKYDDDGDTSSSSSITPIENLRPLLYSYVESELFDALAVEAAAREQMWAPYDWAPGGRKYEAMLRESDGVRAFQELQSSKL